MNRSDQLLYQIALTLVPNIGPATAKNLVAYCGSAAAVFRTPRARLLKVPAIGEERAETIVKADVLKEAEAELKFIEKHGIRPLFFTDADYPLKLKECSDSPLLVYYKGSVSLKHEKTVGIVGTRHATDYGKEVVRKLVEDLSAQDVLIVSGLAYGIDIAAHNAALERQLKTVAVLGHGLNTIYPQAHKATAKKIVSQGGLLTEYRSTEKMATHNFVHRNRIVAGLCDALIVVESAEDGGAMITANLAGSYHRDVFAVPGRMSDKWSRGCNALIKSQRAQLIESGADLLQAMRWETTNLPPKKTMRQRELLLNLSAEEQKIFNALNEADDSGMEIDTLAERTQMSNSALAALLLEMEMNDLIVALPGKRFKPM